MGCSEQSFGPVSCSQPLDFTLLFEETILSIVPSALCLLVVPFEAKRLFKAERKTRISLIRGSKVVIFGLYATLQLAHVVLSSTGSWQRTAASVAAALLTFAVAVCFLCLSIFQDRSLRPSTLMVTYLLFTSVFDAVQVRTLYLTKRNSTITYLLCAIIVMKVVLIFFESKGKRPWLKDNYRGLPPETLSGIVSRVFLYWLNPLFIHGFQGIISMSDLYPIDAALKSQLSSHALRKAYWQNDTPSSWALPKACFSCCRWEIFAMVPARLALIGFTYAQTFLFTRAINLLSEMTNATTLSYGSGLIGATCIIYLGIALSNVLYQQHVNRILTRLRGALISMIYAHALEIADGAHNENAAVTLMSTDVDIITRVLGNLNESWARVIEVVIGISLLSKQVGAICVVPLILALFSTQSQTWISSRIGDRRKAWNASRQKRIGVTATILGSIAPIKISGLMGSTSALIQELRVQEIQSSVVFLRFIAVLGSISEFPSIWAPVVTFIAYDIKARISNEPGINIAQAFTTFALLSLVTGPITNLLNIIPLWAQAKSCFERLHMYFDLPVSPLGRGGKEAGCEGVIITTEETEQGTNTNMMGLRVREDQKNGAAFIVCAGASLNINSDVVHLYPELNFKISQCSLTAVMGPTGSGKTTLLKSILGERKCRKGTISVATSSVAYCSQTPWMTNATAKGFIVQDESVSHAWYQTVVYCCSLDKDFAQLSRGDETIIGSRGISLSGGQRARLALARAIYAQKELCLLDDVFSALDPQTEQIIIYRLFGPSGILRKAGSTAILVTNSERVLKFADNLIVLTKDGGLDYFGAPMQFAGLSRVQEERASHTKTKDDAPALSDSVVTAQTRILEMKGDLVREEGDWRVWKYYFSACSWRFLVLFILLAAIEAFCSTFSQVWLQWWTQDSDDRTTLYLVVFALLALAELSSGYFSTVFVFLKIMPSSAIRLHQVMVSAVSGATYSVFCVTDSGTIVNRFSQDMSLLTGALPTALISTGTSLCSTLASIALIAIGATYVAITIPIVFATVFFVQRFYLRTSRQLRILDLEARSPLTSHFMETVEGVVSIRAFSWQDKSKESHFRLMDASQSPYYLLLSIQTWLKLVLDLITAAVAVLVMALAMSLRGRSSAGSLGVALVNILGLSQSITRLVKEWTNLETSLGAIRRIRSFVDTTPQEIDAPKSDMVTHVSNRGMLCFNQVCASYHGPVGKLALDNVSFNVRPKQKISICGRTGSGKSSMVLVLFRLLDLQSGSIYVDGVDIASVPHDELRQNISAIPQQPFLLPGSVRQSIDPTNTSSERDIRAALHKVQLLKLVDERGGIDSTLDQESLSQGQRQLLGLARILLRKSKIVFMDEATSNLDHETDKVIRDLLRHEFKDCTVISIAHRVQTILESEHVIMLDEGKVVASGDPQQLIRSDVGFRKLFATLE